MIVLMVIVGCLSIFGVEKPDVDGTSMEPNLHDKEELIVDRVSYIVHEPNRGDIITFKAPPRPADVFVKRIIGLPGDDIEVSGTSVKVNGILLRESYVGSRFQGIPFYFQVHPYIHIKVTPHHYFVLGDNRLVSNDSRSWGLLPRENIIGRVILILGSLDQKNLGLLPDYSAVFVHLPAP